MRDGDGGEPVLTLYLAPGSSSMAPHIALREVGAPFEARTLSFARREHRGPAYLAVNPEDKVPTLLVDGRPLTEVAGILFFLARRFPAAGLLPDGGIEAEAEVVSWMSFLAASVHPARCGRSPSGGWVAESGRSAGACRSPTSTCSGCSGALSTRCTPRPAPSRGWRRTMLA